MKKPKPYCVKCRVEMRFRKGELAKVRPAKFSCDSCGEIVLAGTSKFPTPFDIVRRLQQGYSTKDVASTLGASRQTVEDIARIRKECKSLNLIKNGRWKVPAEDRPSGWMLLLSEKASSEAGRCSVENCIRPASGRGFESEGESIGLCEIHNSMVDWFVSDGMPPGWIAAKFGVGVDEVNEAIRTEMLGLWLERL